MLNDNQKICHNCGLPVEICACSSISTMEEIIYINVEKRRYGKSITTISGLTTLQKDVKNLLKTLKKKLACGGTLKSGIIELQGNHKDKIVKILLDFGFSENNINW